MNEKLITIQQELSVPKNQRNNFGNYNYRSCEDILEALKPLLRKTGLLLTISDEIIQFTSTSTPAPVQITDKNGTHTEIVGGDRYYVKSTVTLREADKAGQIESVGFAREEENKKGMDGSQITGAASSYARKYALNAMFLIDDTKDSDATNDGKDEVVKTVAKTAPQTPTEDLGKCLKCGAPNKLSLKGGKYCSALCWKNPPQEIPTKDINADKAVTANDDGLDQINVNELGF